MVCVRVCVCCVCSVSVCRNRFPICSTFDRFVMFSCCLFKDLQLMVCP